MAKIGNIQLCKKVKSGDDCALGHNGTPYISASDISHIERSQV